jgi:hypothetical protein
MSTGTVVATASGAPGDVGAEGARGALAEPPGPTTVATERLALTSLEHHLERRLRSAALL